MPKRLIPLIIAHEYPGSELTPEEVEFANAMQAYQHRYQRRFPAWSEVLYVLRTLGYRRDDEREDEEFRKRLTKASLELASRDAQRSA